MYLLRHNGVLIFTKPEGHWIIIDIYPHDTRLVILIFKESETIIIIEASLNICILYCLVLVPLYLNRLFYFVLFNTNPSLGVFCFAILNEVVNIELFIYLNMTQNLKYLTYVTYKTDTNILEKLLGNRQYYMIQY